MSVVHIIKPAKPSLNSFEFATYNEANAFRLKSAALNPTKPYRRIRSDGPPLWVVSVLNPRAMRSKAEVITLRGGDEPVRLPRGYFTTWKPGYLGPDKLAA